MQIHNIRNWCHQLLFALFLPSSTPLLSRNGRSSSPHSYVFFHVPKLFVNQKDNTEIFQQMLYQVLVWRFMRSSTRKKGSIK